MIDPRIAALEPDLERIAKTNGRPPADDNAKTEKVSQATRLVAIVLEHVEFFSSPDGIAHATATIGEHQETWSLRSKRFRAWLQRSAYSTEGKTPGAQAVQDALGVLEGTALFGAPEKPVALRVAGDDKVIYLDLGGDSWETIEITAAGWQLGQAQVRMCRSSSMAALPLPARGGSLDDLRRYQRPGGARLDSHRRVARRRAPAERSLPGPRPPRRARRREVHRGPARPTAGP